MRWQVVVVVAAVWLWLLGAGAWGQYVVTDLGTLPGGSQSGAYGLNNKGQVVGGATASAGYEARVYLHQWDDDRSAGPPRRCPQ